jgi:predicted TIM-barrel fold metal-dependent hydrolase
MIVDAHTHIAESGRHGPFGFEASAERLIGEMDQAGVDFSIVIPTPGVASNEFVQREAARFPSRLASLYCPDFEAPRDTVAKLEHFVRDHRTVGLKIHPRLQGVTVADSVVKDVLAWACANSMPVVFDVFPWGPELDDDRIHPLAYHGIARELPDLKLVLAHSGGYKVLEAFLVAKSNPNIFLDVSFTFAYFRGASAAADLAFVCGRLPVGRVIYGSDFPHVHLGEYLRTVREQTAGLVETNARALFGESACSLFRLG